MILTNGLVHPKELFVSGVASDAERGIEGLYMLCSDVVAFACVILSLLLTSLLEVLRMISEVVLQVLADCKSILFGLRFKRFGVEFCIEL
ncbi:hypothetical protein Tco_1071753, partial [Tanacetum coccineum]